MRKRLVIFGVLLFIIAVSISYILSNVVNTLDSNTLKEIKEKEDSSQENFSVYFISILFLIFVYLIYHLFFVELKPWLKMRDVKRRKDPIEFMEYLSDEIEKSRKDEKRKQALIEKLNHFYSYAEKDEKEKAKSIRGIRKYIIE